VKLLAPHFTRANVDELLATATHMTTAQVRQLVAERFPKPDMPTLVRAIAGPAAVQVLEPCEAVPSSEPDAASLLVPLVSKPVAPTNSADSSAAMVPVVAASAAYARIEPTSPGRYSLQLTLSQETHSLLREAQALLGHAVPSGDIDTVLQRALNGLVQQLRKQKLAETEQPRAQRGSTSDRHIPAEVQRAVLKRDGGRCTFVTDTGKRCDETTRLEWDHVVPVARGGTSTAGNLRLLCRTHNQYAAEQLYGEEFMQGKRAQSGAGARATP
jgi:5-methylcytosine-specific restriction endonuclease McrA